MKKHNATTMEELKREVGEVMFDMALMQLIEAGKEVVSIIGDEAIEEVEGSILVGKEWMKELFITIRELSEFNTVHEIYPYLMCDKNKLHRMTIIAQNAIILGELWEDYSKDDLMNELGMTEDEYKEIIRC